MSLASKPGYIDTSIGWIPSEWKFVPIKNIAQESILRNGKNDSLPVILCSKHHGFVRSLDYFKKKIFSDDTSNYKVVRRNWIAYPSNHIEEGSIGLQTICDAGIVSPIYTVFYLAEVVEPDFIIRLLKTELYRKQYVAAMNGSVDRRGSLRWAQFSQICVPLPPRQEQRKIAAILTTVDDKLNVISRQIEAVKALKRGLMQKLFNRGVGVQMANGRWAPHTEFKDTELGEIPEVWAVQALETLAESITVGIATSTTEHYVEDGIPLIRNQNIKEDFLDMSDLLKISAEFDAKNKRKRVLEGDILTVRTGYPGVSCVVPKGLGYLQTFTTLITRPNQKLICPSFASSYFNSPQGKALMLHQAAGGAQQNINAGNLKKLLVPVPPLVEQERISGILAAVDQKRRSLEAKGEQYRIIKRGLMQKLLTGEWRVKLDSSTGTT